MNSERRLDYGKLLAIGVIALLGLTLMGGALFAPKTARESPRVGGLMAITTTRSCDFVTFEGRTYQVCDDGVIGIFTALEALPFKANQVMKE